MPVTLVRMLLHQPLLPPQLTDARKHRDILSAHNVTEHPFKTPGEDNWTLHWPKGLVIVTADATKDPIPYAHNVLFIALGHQLVPETSSVMLGNKPWEPNWSVPPGETIQEILEELGVNPLRLAERAGLSLAHVHRIIRGQEVIDAETAVRLEHALAIKAEMWLAMDTAHQLHLARTRHADNGCQCRSLRPTSDTEQVTP